MSNLDIVRAWKDEDYRNGLSKTQMALLPENPAGLIELDDLDLALAAGGTDVKRTFSCTKSRHCTCNCTIKESASPAGASVVGLAG